MQILTIRKGYKAFEFKLEPFQPNSKHLNANSNTLNEIRDSKDSNAYSNTEKRSINVNSIYSNEIWNIRMHILIIAERFKQFKCKLELLIVM